MTKQTEMNHAMMIYIIIYLLLILILDSFKEMVYSYIRILNIYLLISNYFIIFFSIL